ncbi:MAG: hypothetical protein RR865_04820 [Clostridia bacterium]
MKHHIIVKFQSQVTNKPALYQDIGALFQKAYDVQGVHSVSLHPNVTDRPNRYDLMIVIDMDQDKLPLFDASQVHHEWKDRYSSIIEQKAIFDCN